MRHKQSGRRSENRIHNEIDQSTPYKQKKCSFCRSIGHNRRNCSNKH